MQIELGKTYLTVNKTQVIITQQTNTTSGRVYWGFILDNRKTSRKVRYDDIGQADDPQLSIVAAVVVRTAQPKVEKVQTFDEVEALTALAPAQLEEEIEEVLDGYYNDK